MGRRALLSPGFQLGRYRLLRWLGSGGMADVYEAEDETLKRRVALKVLSPELARDPVLIGRFETEVLAAAGLNHRGIVTVHEVGSQDAYQFYSMRLLPGGDLRRRINEGLTPAESLEILRAVADAFAHAHAKGFVHRDVKPENILFDEQGLPVLTDFGIVKALHGDTVLTLAGTAVGSPRYMSPEQAGAKAVDGRADLYSLGVILHEMLTGRPPFDAADLLALLHQHLTAPIPRLPRAVAHLQPLLDRLLAKDPPARVPSGQALVRLVDELTAGPRGRRWMFANAVFDESTLALTVDGAVEVVEPVLADVLLVLLSHAGEVVTPGEILEAVWPGSPQPESVLSGCVADLRLVLKDADQKIIKTQGEFGYSLVAKATVEAGTAPPAPNFDFKPGDHPPGRPHWNLVERLGAGGHGEAWLARHEKTKEPRVFKFALNAEALTSLKREITLYRVLHDSFGARASIVEIHDWNLEQPPYFIETEYTDGGSLSDWAKKQGGLERIPLQTRLDLVARVAETLAAAHSVGVLHKDLKPSNILISSPLPAEAGTGSAEDPGVAWLCVKLADFGSGSVLDPRRLEQLGISRMGFTKTVTALDATSGTPIYLAPEVIAGQPFTVQADVYSLGVVLYQLAVGDLTKALALGWESEIDDELLREDIAASAAGDPQKRLPEASQLAQRIRTQSQRRAKRAVQRDAARYTEQLQQALQRARVRTRVALFVVGVLILAAFPTGKYYRDAMQSQLHARQAGRDAEQAQHEAGLAQREAGQAQREAEAVSNFLSGELLSMADPNLGRTDDLSFKAVITRAAARVDQKLAGQPAAAAKVHLALARSMHYLHLEVEALKHTERAAALYEQSYGRDSPLTHDALVELAWALSRNGRPDEAAALSTEVIAYARKQWGENDLRALNVEFDMATLQRTLGHVVEPAERMGSLIEARKRYVPAQAESRGWYYEYGQALMLAADFTRAEQAFRRALDLHARKHDTDNYFAAWMEARHGGALIHLGRFGEAEREIRSAHDKMARWRGPDNEHTIAIHGRIGDVLFSSGRVDKALALLEADSARCRVHGCTAKLISEIDLRLSRAYLLAGKPQAAVPLLVDAIRQFGSEVVWVNRPLADSQLLLAEALLATGKLTQAQALVDGIPARYLSTLPPKHPSLAGMRRLQGLIWFRQGQFDKAHAALVEAEGIYRFRYGQDHWLSKRAREDLLLAGRTRAP
jgi:serine/threonine protein kinase